MIHHRRPGFPGDARHVVENLRLSISADDRNPLHRAHRIHSVLRRQRRNHVRHALRADPKIWRGLKARRQRHQRVIRHVLLRKSNRLRPRAIHFHVQLRQIQRLLDVHVHRPAHFLDARQHLARHLEIVREIRTHKLHVNRRWQSEIQNLADDIGRLKVKRRPWKFTGECFSQLADVILGGMMIFLQGDQDFGIRSADGSRGAVTQVDSAVRQPDIVENSLHLLRGDLLANGILDAIGQRRRFFHPQPNRSAHVQPNLSGIHGGKKVRAQERNQQHARGAERQEKRAKCQAIVQAPFQPAYIPVAKILEAFLKTQMNSPEQTRMRISFGMFSLFAALGAEKEKHQRRHNRSRQKVGSQHREYYGLCQRPEKIAGNSAQKKYGNEDHANAQRGHEGGHRNLLRAEQDRIVQRLAHGQKPVNVFNFDGGVVHQYAHGQRQASERHDVDRLAERGEHQQRSQNGKRNRNGHHHRAAPASQEQQDHHRRQAGGGHRFLQHSIHRGAHEQRLIDGLLQRQLRRHLRFQARQLLRNPVHHRQR